MTRNWYIVACASDIEFDGERKRVDTKYSREMRKMNYHLQWIHLAFWWSKMWLHGGRRQWEASIDRQSFVTITTKATRVVKFNIHCHNHCEKMMKKVLLLLMLWSVRCGSIPLVEGICLCAAHHTHTYVCSFVRLTYIFPFVTHNTHIQTCIKQISSLHTKSKCYYAKDEY